MSGSTETATATAPNSTPTAQVQAEPLLYIRPYASAGYKPVVTSPPPPPPELLPPGAIIIKHVNNNSDPKRKRGRPRKYGPDSGVVPPQQPINAAVPQNLSSRPEQMGSQPPVGDSAAGPTVRNSMGRPRGSKNKKQRTIEILGSNGNKFIPHILTVQPGEVYNLAGSNGNKFIPHILTVQPGEDVARKIMAFSHSGSRAVCILSGTGAVTNVALSQAATSGGTATYEGRFEILSLSGSFIPTETGDHRNRSGGLSITLVGTRGVFGGCVSNFLIAATSVQVIVGSFVADGYGEPRLPNQMEPSSVKLGVGGAAGFGSSPRGTQSESSGEPASHQNFGSGAFNNVSQGMLWK